MKKVNDVSTRAISGPNYFLPLVWNCMIELKPLIKYFSFRLYSVFISPQLLNTPDRLHKCSTKFLFSFEKSWKWKGLLLVLISLLNHKNRDLRQLGVSERKASVFPWMEDVYVELRKRIKGNIKVKVRVKKKTFSECIFN